MFTAALIGGYADGTLMQVPGIDAPIRVVRMHAVDYQPQKPEEKIKLIPTPQDVYCFTGGMTRKGYLIATLNGTNIPKNIR